MARWLKHERASFEDMPRRLRAVGLDSSEELKRARAAWLEASGLTLIDYFAWLRDQRGPQVPARRKQMSAEQLADLDRQREREEPPQW